MKWQPARIKLPDTVIADEMRPVLDEHQTYVLGRYYNFCQKNDWPAKTLELTKDPILGLPDFRRAAIFTGHKNPESLRAYYRRFLC